MFLSPTGFHFSQTTPKPFFFFSRDKSVLQAQTQLVDYALCDIVDYPTQQLTDVDVNSSLCSTKKHVLSGGHRSVHVK